MRRRKILLVILDGLGDLPSPALGGRTPLEAAATPVLDGLMEAGVGGLVDPVAPGIAAETHAGTAPLLGLEAKALEGLARGPIEAAGAGLELAPGDIALRGNFATVVAEGGDLAIVDRRAGRIRERTQELVDALEGIGPIDGVQIRVRAQKQHRIVLQLAGEDLSAAIEDTDPGSGRPQRLRSSHASGEDAAAARTADVLDRFLRRAHERLAAHPLNRERAARGLPVANAILTRGAGVAQPIEGRLRQLGLRGAVVTGDRALLGLARLLGFTGITAPGFTALADSDPRAKVAAARAALAEHDIVWLHYKATDITAHDRQPQLKRDCIARFDAALAPLCDEDVVIGVTADHTTDSNSGSHTADPVPALLRASDGPRDGLRAFSEKACREGGLGRVRAAEYLHQVLQLAGALDSQPDG